MAYEPYRQQTPEGGKEMRYYVVFKSQRCFAHKKIQKKLYDAGMAGHVSIGTRRGWVEYMEHLLCEIPRKLLAQQGEIQTAGKTPSDRRDTG